MEVYAPCGFERHRAGGYDGDNLGEEYGGLVAFEEAPGHDGEGGYVAFVEGEADEAYPAEGDHRHDWSRKWHD